MKLTILAMAMLVFIGCAPQATTAGQPTRPAGDLEFFQRMLIEQGDDLHSSFGADLSMLGLEGRKLQEMPIRQAYSSAHETALRVSNVRLRRRMLLDLFNETEE